MSSRKFIYNPMLMKFERVHFSFKHKCKRLVPYITLTLLFSTLLFYTYNSLIQSPKLYLLNENQSNLLLKFSLLDLNTRNLNELLEEIEYNDDHIFRTYFEVDPLPSTTRNAGFGGNDNYSAFVSSKFYPLLSEIARHLDILTKKSLVQVRSFDEVMDMAINKEKRLAARPAIQPVRINDLTRFGSSFGMRFHPITQQYKMHEGIDLTADRGTKVYATAEGIATEAEFTGGGYGNKIVLDHGYGYKTLYAHLNKILIEPGQYVNRGDVIGTVGNTGLSTCPHLHYEVHVNGKKVNPINYYTSDLSAEEYDRIVGLLSDADPGFDIN